MCAFAKMNAKLIVLLLIICAAPQLTHARPAATEDSVEQQSTWDKWTSIAFNWLPGVWRVFSNGFEKAVIVQRVNIHKDVLIHQQVGNHSADAFIPVRPENPQTQSNDAALYDEWIMISAPIAIVVLVTMLFCISIFSALRSLCCCCR